MVYFVFLTWSLHDVLGETVKAYEQLIVFRIICHRLRIDLMQEGMGMFRERTLRVDLLSSARGWVSSSGPAAFLLSMVAAVLTNQS